MCEQRVASLAKIHYNKANEYGKMRGKRVVRFTPPYREEMSSTESISMAGRAEFALEQAPEHSLFCKVLPALSRYQNEVCH